MKKKLYFLLLLATPLFLINCGDDDGDGDFNAQFVGQWEATSVTSTGCDNSEENGTLTCSPFCFQVEFNDDRTYSLTDGTGDPVVDESGTFEATATTLNLCSDGTCDSDPATYAFIDDDTVAVTFTDDDSPGCQFTATFTRQ